MKPPPTRCPSCGRFARRDPHYGERWCDHCDRPKTKGPVQLNLPGMTPQDKIDAIRNQLPPRDPPKRRRRQRAA